MARRTVLYHAVPWVKLFECRGSSAESQVPWVKFHGSSGSSGVGQVRIDPTHGTNVKKNARRGLSEEHVHANLNACERTVQQFMDKHADKALGAGAVMLITLGETSNSASDVRDRLVDFIDKTVGENSL